VWQTEPAVYTGLVQRWESCFLCFLLNLKPRKKRTRHSFSRGRIAATRKPKQIQIVMQTHPQNALHIFALSERCPVPPRKNANSKPLRLGSFSLAVAIWCWHSLEQNSSPSYRVHGQNEGPLPKHFNRIARNHEILLGTPQIPQ